jgi:hypothetical protein
VNETLDLPGALVRLYQDGLPVWDKEAQIVREVAAQGNPNHLLLVECCVPSDHIPVGSWSLFKSRQLMRDVIESLQVEKKS